MFAKYLLAWLLLAVIAIANGIIRQATYGRLLPELAAHQVSTVTAIAATGLAVWRVHRARPIASSAEAWAIGAAWLVMTVLFEFGFGHYVAGHSWPKLLADYNLLEGRLWSLFLAWILVLPVVVFTIAGRAGNGGQP